MGYFRRKLDRGRNRKVAQRLREMALEDDFRHVWEAIPDRPPRKTCFLRFSIARKHPESKRRMGVFRAAGELLDSGELGPQTSGVLQEACDWFNDNLPVPADVDRPDAVFLFKSDAGECTRRIWELVWILREAGLVAEMQKATRPGRIVYEDAYQVAVVTRKNVIARPDFAQQKPLWVVA